MSQAMPQSHYDCPCMEKCPLHHAMQLIGGKWKVQILCAVANAGTIRYNALRGKLLLSWPARGEFLRGPSAGVGPCCRAAAIGRAMEWPVSCPRRKLPAHRPKPQVPGKLPNTLR